MRTIYSKDNKLYKLCLELSERRGRKKHGLFIIEGEKLVAEALLQGVEIYALIESDTHREKAGAAEEYRQDKGGAKAYLSASDYVQPPESGRRSAENVISAYCIDELFKDICGTETPQGILAVAKIPERLNEEAFIKKAAGCNVIALDRLQDPGNVGTIIRTAEAAGYGGLVLVKGTGDVYSPKVVRAAAGSLLRMPLYFAESADEVAMLAKKGGYKLIATAMGEGSEDYRNLPKDARLMPVVGNEGSGVSGEFIEKADMLVRIPMRGKVESLNASVAAALIMYKEI